MRITVPLLALALGLACAGPAAASDVGGSPSTILAQQGNVVVTLADVDAFADGMPEKDRAGFFNSPTRIQNLISGMLLQKQLAAEARANGLDKDPQVALQVAQAADAALGKARMEQFRAQLEVPDFSQLAKEDFLANKEKYVTPGKLDVEQVLIEAKTRTLEEARALAGKVRQEAVADPAGFEALVEKYSDDPAKVASKGLVHDAGDAKKYVAAFADAARALDKVGEISPVIETPYGFHVLKLVERTPDHVPTYDEVKERIMAQLRASYIEKAVQTHTDTLRNLPMDANAELVASLRTRYATQGGAEAPAK